jgi:hypothetical protein
VLAQPNAGSKMCAQWTLQLRSHHTASVRRVDHWYALSVVKVDSSITCSRFWTMLNAADCAEAELATMNFTRPVATVLFSQAWVLDQLANACRSVFWNSTRELQLAVVALMKGTACLRTTEEAPPAGPAVILTASGFQIAIVSAACKLR